MQENISSIIDTSNNHTGQDAISSASLSSPTKNVDERQFITMNMALVLCTLTMLFTLLLCLYAPTIAANRGLSIPGVAPRNKVVYLDIEKILASGIKRSMNTAADLVNVQAQADKFQVDIAAAVQFYGDAGYIVINSKALIGATKSQDITGDVLAKLGLK